MLADAALAFSLSRRSSSKPGEACFDFSHNSSGPAKNAHLPACMDYNFERSVPSFPTCIAEQKASSLSLRLLSKPVDVRGVGESTFFQRMIFVHVPALTVHPHAA